MNNTYRALFVINEVYADEYVKQHMTSLKVAQALADAGLLAPEPQIIRTREEMIALDPDTLLLPAYQFTNGWRSCNQKSVFRAAAAYRLDLTFHGPAVAIATGDHVRAARQALKEES